MLIANVAWVLPLVSAIVWLGMLAAMLGYWVARGSPHYPSFNADQHIAYISDVGASNLKPLFIAGCSVMVVTLDLAMIAERWLRHSGRLAHNTSRWQKALSGLAIFTAIIGACGLILLSIFDTRRYPHVHDAMLAVFIIGYVLSAIFICAEYQRLGIHFRQRPILRYSFWIKLVFIIVEVGLAIGFGVETDRARYNPGAILEWIIALIFTGYILSFFVDLFPAVRHKPGSLNAADPEMAGVDHYSAGSGQGLTDGAGDRFYAQPYASTEPQPPSRNF
ncbi:hypothetical protein EV356DRAFT_380379 [Viridothelium virens]|uniref:CWH43-like N-terminal domain-containing protein n=1 Tax=Viridothelium virens TaxID=1048519 RepID=A0A6A6HJG9_VIRVR|nr:hypothetical protein EV356DRAFT_380379 [Viridothelium virens]